MQKVQLTRRPYMILAAGDQVSNAKEGAVETFLLSVEETLSHFMMSTHFGTLNRIRLSTATDAIWILIMRSVVNCNFLVIV